MSSFQCKLLTVVNLLSESSPAEVVQAITLERFAEQRVERFAGAHGRRGVRRDRERGDVRELLKAITAQRRAVQTRRVLKVLRQTLQERQRLTEVHLHTTTRSPTDLHINTPTYISPVTATLFN